jgi:hypothetical protein
VRGPLLTKVKNNVQQQLDPIKAEAFKTSHQMAGQTQTGIPSSMYFMLHMSVHSLSKLLIQRVTKGDSKNADYSTGAD